MLCSHCGICCKKTEMLLSNKDIERLEIKGYLKEKFVRYEKKGFAKLQNHRGYCVFYDREKHRCKVYEHRPSGCRIYPVVYDEEKGIVLDDICPMRDTVTEAEKERKGKKVMRLLKRIDREARNRTFHMNFSNNLK